MELILGVHHLPSAVRSACWPIPWPERVSRFVRCSALRASRVRPPVSSRLESTSSVTLTPLPRVRPLLRTWSAELRCYR